MSFQTCMAFFLPWISSIDRWMCLHSFHFWVNYLFGFWFPERNFTHCIFFQLQFDPFVLKVLYQCLSQTFRGRRRWQVSKRARGLDGSGPGNSWRHGFQAAPWLGCHNWHRGKSESGSWWRQLWTFIWRDKERKTRDYVYYSFTYLHESFDSPYVLNKSLCLKIIMIF